MELVELVVKLLDDCERVGRPIPHGYHAAALLAARLVKKVGQSVKDGSLPGTTSVAKGKVIAFKQAILNESFVFVDPSSAARNLSYLDLQYSVDKRKSLDVAIDSTPEVLLLIALAGVKPLERIEAPFLALVGDAITGDAAHVAALARFYRLARGQIFHATNEYKRKSDPVAATNLDIAVDYSQFEDVAYVMSEANEKQDVLDRFLRLYQVLENFMIRRVVAKLANATPGRVFSLRDFRGLYKSFIDGEIKTLSNLFGEALKIAVPASAPGGPHADLEAYIRYLWHSGLPHASMHADLEVLLDRIDPGGGYKPINSFHSQLDGRKFARLIYAVRNSIVHNKETEFHLTHKTLTPALVILMNEVLFPALEEMIFSCVCAPTPGNFVRYDHRQMALYERIA
ncbi:hypothetical protein AYO46_00135 [Betaproteobacteria bacterium SCGC AG-212-J23]|nr:hypothetical protein AYO46_00135 [Betaproteobacteria bacterium SCGC AG-212-J23]